MYRFWNSLYSRHQNISKNRIPHHWSSWRQNTKLVNCLHCGGPAPLVEFRSNYEECQSTCYFGDRRKCHCKEYAFRFMVGPGYCAMISKYGPSLSKAVGPVDPSFLVVKKSRFNKKKIHVFILQRVYQLHKTERTCT